MPRCPVCKTLTDLIKYESVPIYNCGSCGGHWLTQARLDVILARREVVMPEPVQQKMIEIADAANSRQPLWCITCGREMRKEQFKHWPEIQLDRCPKCEGLWLDRGELEKCQIYWERWQDHPADWAGMDVAARTALLDAELAQRRAQNRAQRERIAQVRASRNHSPGYAAVLFGLFG